MEPYEYDPQDLRRVAKHVENWLLYHGISYVVVTTDYTALNMFTVRVKPLRGEDKTYTVLIINGKPVIQ